MTDDAWRQRLLEVEARGEKLVDLSSVEVWVYRQKGAWETLGYVVEIFPITEGVSKNSLRFNLDNAQTVVSTTIVWDSGEWEVSVGYVEAEQPETSEYEPAQSTEEVILKVEVALERMGITR